MERWKGVKCKLIENRNRDECSGCPWWADSNDAVESRYFVSTLIGLLKVFLSLSSLLALALLSQLISLSFCLLKVAMKASFENLYRWQPTCAGERVAGVRHDGPHQVGLRINHLWSGVVIRCFWLSFGWSLVVVSCHWCSLLTILVVIGCYWLSLVFIFGGHWC